VIDALITWDFIGELQITDLSLKFFRQFDQNIEIGTYSKGSEGYERLTYAITSWAEKTILFVADHTPDDYVLTLAMDATSGEPVGPRGVLHCLVSAISLYDAYNGLVPPSWAHGSRFSEQARNNTVINNYHNSTYGTGSQFVVGFEAE
jgi:glucoamylase